MKEDNKNKINRRDFFKLAGAGTLASAAALYGCSGNKNNGESESAALGEIPTGKMTYRTNPNTGDRVSLLGYGCMRWPTRKRADGNGDEIDQEAVNDLIDYAIAHGVNYFDTSPAYVQGLSERATGIALKRHPREKFFLATKPVQLQSQHAQPRRVPCHVSPLLPRPASGLHRLPPAARHRHGRHGSPPFPLSGQRHAGLPAERARSRTHPQPRILLSWRHRSL